ncbi:rRNA maturation RNase YbeY [Candidatus Parcubacteria bacterium]|nr:MAG: rRNA maturation RNase YbeY [Candidatus Parcubacteria bacterium]
MEVNINNVSESLINEEELEDFLQFISGKYELKNKEISIAIVDDKEIRKINKEYRKKDSVTDVLSFEGEDDFLGELIVDFDQIKRQAKYYSDDTHDELLFIILHGVLHLLGDSDETEEERVAMIEKGIKILNEFKNKYVK